MENFQQQPLLPGVNPMPNTSSGAAHMYPPASYIPHPMNVHNGEQPHYPGNIFPVIPPNASLPSGLNFYPHFQPSSQLVPCIGGFAPQPPQNVDGQQSGLPQHNTAFQPGKPGLPTSFSSFKRYWIFFFWDR